MAQACFLRHNILMPKVIPETELNAIVKIVRGFSRPVSIEEISASRSLEGLPRRNLQRRLKLLVENNRLIGISERGGRRYVVPETERVVPEEKKPAVPPEIIPLSPESKEIRAIG